MLALIDAAFDRTRTAMLVLVFLLIAGGTAYLTIPKEAEPDVAIPIVYVSLSYEGISPEDAERLLVRPMEKELQGLEGLKKLTGSAGEGYASILLEFDAGFDADKAMTDVRDKVDIAKAELPDDTDEPRVSEVNVALFPVLTITLSGPVPERTLVTMARQLKDHIEAVPGVLEVDIGGDREELMEVVVQPQVMETYGVRYDELFSLVARNNQLVAAGALDTGAGRFVVKVPGIIESIDDVLTLPVKVSEGTVVTFRDVAEVRRTFKDPEGFARIDGQPAVALEVKKRIGANIIETVGQVRAVVDAIRVGWPATVKVHYLQDKSEEIREMLRDLQNNIISAILLVMVVIVAALGPRSSVLVGLSIPGSFLVGVLALHAMGYTLNIVTLFSLILVVGMLVDGAIVVTEYADRRLAEGASPRSAFMAAAKRMAWPVLTSTATTLAVFIPLLFWPGVVGQFMKYLPITVLVTLVASRAMALVFVPVLGSLVGRAGRDHQLQLEAVKRAETGDLLSMGGATGIYLRALAGLLKRPGRTLFVALALMVGTYVTYVEFGHGVEFFPEVEPEFAQVQVRARGDLSVWEKDALLRRVENQLHDQPEIESLYARSFNRPSDQLAEDVIGVVQLDFVSWRERRPADTILAELRQLLSSIPGVVIEARKPDSGPAAGKPISLEVSAQDPALLEPAVAHARRLMQEIGGFVDLEDSRPLPGIEWRLEVDRELAARYGADVTTLGSAVQMVTNGIRVAGYRPDHTDEEVDIRVRFPFADRNFDQLDQLRVNTAQGPIPVTNFVRFTPAPKTGNIERIDGRRVLTLAADVAEGVLADNQVRALREALTREPPAEGVEISFRGEDEDMRETMSFLLRAFVTAIFVMFLMLVTQFNSIYQALLVMSAIVLSTAGVLLGLLATSQPFGIVMGGIGVIALAGIVVNNNIVLIDTYNDLRRNGAEAPAAALRSAAQRMRPVLLTAVTTVLGLMPMVMAVNIDLINRDIAIGAPSTQWWTQLSSAIAGGLTFATALTLILTPCMLVLGERVFGARTAAPPSSADASPAAGALA